MFCNFLHDFLKTLPKTQPVRREGDILSPPSPFKTNPHLRDGAGQYRLGDGNDGMLKNISLLILHTPEIRKWYLPFLSYCIYNHSSTLPVYHTKESAYTSHQNPIILLEIPGKSYHNKNILPWIFDSQDNYTSRRAFNSDFSARSGGGGGTDLDLGYKMQGLVRTWQILWAENPSL